MQPILAGKVVDPGELALVVRGVVVAFWKIFQTMLVSDPFSVMTLHIATFELTDCNVVRDVLDDLPPQGCCHLGDRAGIQPNLGR